MSRSRFEDERRPLHSHAGRGPIAWGILLAIPLLTAACTESPAPREVATTVVFKHGKLFGDTTAFEGLLGQFEREHPGVRVRSESLPAASDAQHQFYAISLSARSAEFDVLALDVIWVAEFARAGWLRDLSALLPAAERAQFFSGPIEAVTWEGKPYALPWFMDAGVLYYRKDLLDKHGFVPPKTWPELARIAQAVRDKESGMHGFVWQGKQYEGLVCNALEYLWSNGGGAVDSDTIALNTAANREALAFVRSLLTSGVTPEFVTTLTEEPAREVFGRGAAVFLRNWPYAWQLFEQEGSAVRGKVGVSVLPHFPGQRSAATLGGWQLGVSKFSKHPQAAEQLVKFLTSSGAQRVLALAYGYNPPRHALYQDGELLAVQPHLRTLETVYAHARPRPVTPHYVRLSQILQAEFSAAVTGVKTPGEALASAQREARQRLP
ncbi:MAG: ABC transporter substrate-binding protein [Pseudomonadota bacterium]|nr:MAG: ABC transporter substrate-binding protein [Pseudomonadota bacterium]